MKTKLLFSQLVICGIALMSFFEMKAQGVWTQKANVGTTGRCNAVGFSIGTKGYIGTGFNANSPSQQLKDFWEWDQASNVWTQKADFGGTARWDAVGFSIGTKGYIGTGYDGVSGYVQDFWEWNQTSNVWTQKANCGGNPRQSAVGFSIGSKGYIGTGYKSGCMQDFWEWDQSSNVWTQKANFGGSARYFAMSFVIGSCGYIGTGKLSNGTYGQDLWEWNQSTNTWTQKASFPGTARYGAVGFSIGKYGFIGTGTAGTNMQDFYEWNQGTNTWTQQTDFGGTARNSAVGFSIGTKGYIGTGTDGNYRQDFWEYNSALTGIEENNIQQSAEIYPNPFTDIATLKISSDVNVSNGIINLFDLSGKEVKRVTFSGNEATIDRENLKNEIYFYQITINNKNIITGKIIVE